MALTLRNRKFYACAFGACVVAATGIYYAVYRSFGALQLSAILTGIVGFFYFLYKQHIDETRLFKDLFTEFNCRYDSLNNRLNEIAMDETGEPLKSSDRNIVFDYFNLCAEEYFFYQTNYIDQAVWDSWRHGMAFFFNKPRIRDLWNEECASVDERASYYGFEPPPYEGPTNLGTRQSDHPSSLAVETKTSLSSGSWQGASTAERISRSQSFLVHRHFAGVPLKSIEWSQEFVDVCLLYRAQAFRTDQGVGFEPNFAFIERVYTEEQGFAASFFGTPQEYSKHGYELQPGRGESYSRLKVKNPQHLAVALKCIHIAAQLKNVGRVGWRA